MTPADERKETEFTQEPQRRTPYIRLTDNQSDALAEIDTKLRSTLEIANKTLGIASVDLPQIEESFTTARDGIQRIAEQVVEANKSFRTTKHQIQARTEALNDNINSLTSHIDKLRVLVKNIRDDDFESGEYYNIFSELATRIFAHLAKTHDPSSQDLNEFRDLTWRTNDIISKLDPIARRAHVANWPTTFQNALTMSRTEKELKNTLRKRDDTALRTIRETLDEIPEPSNPRQRFASTGNHITEYGRNVKRPRKGKERSHD